MLKKGPAKKVTIYVNEDTRYHREPLYEAILGFLMHKGVAGATASRAIAGFGAHRVLHTPRVEVLAMHLPIRVEFIETAEKVDELLPTLYDMVADGLIEVQDTAVLKAATKGKRPEPAEHVLHEEKRGPAKLMRIFLGEADRWKGEPLYEAIVKQLRMMDIAGATVYRGILGYGAKGHTHKDRFLHRSHDASIMITVIDAADKVAAARDVVSEMIEDGLIVTSDVDVIRVIHSHPPMEAGDAGTHAG